MADFLKSNEVISIIIIASRIFNVVEANNAALTPSETFDKLWINKYVFIFLLIATQCLRCTLFETCRYSNIYLNLKCTCFEKKCIPKKFDKTI